MLPIAHLSRKEFSKLVNFLFPKKKLGYNPTVLAVIDYFDYLYSNIPYVTASNIQNIFSEQEMLEVKMALIYIERLKLTLLVIFI